MSRAASDSARRSATSTVSLPARGRPASPDAVTPGADAGRGGRLNATVARWPLDVDPGFESEWNGDPSIAVVRRSLADYRSGRADQASRVWQDDIVWTVRGAAPAGGRWTGAEGVFAYHRLLDRLSGGTYRQRLVALEGCHGPIVTAYLRTTAARKGRRLAIPTLAVFELVGGRVSRVTQLPGDLEAWQAFWAD